MAITLGRLGASPPVGTNIISATYTEEVESIDISNRSNITGGYKASVTGFSNRTWEIECHSVGTLVSDLIGVGTEGAFNIMSVTENMAVDGVVTYNVTAKQF